MTAIDTFGAARAAVADGAAPRYADGPRGSVLFNSTCFPVTMARGATLDSDL